MTGEEPTEHDGGGVRQYAQETLPFLPKQACMPMLRLVLYCTITDVYGYQPFESFPALAS